MIEFSLPIRPDALSQLAEGWRDRIRMPPAMRADGVVCAKGIRLCEFNMSPGGNGGEWKSAFLSHWFGVKPDPRDGLLDVMRNLVRRNGGKLVVGILEGAKRGEPAWIETRDLLMWFREIRGLTAFQTDAKKLRPRNGRMHDGVRGFDALYPAYAFEGRSRLDPVLRLLKSALQTKTVFVTDPIDLRIDDKALMALLSAAAEREFASSLSARECSLVRRYIPWTRLVWWNPGASVPSALLKRREMLVLKRTRSLNSLHVHAGYECSPRAWRMLLERAARSRIPWVLQERVLPKPHWVQTPNGWELRDCMICPFVFGQAWAGTIVRVAEKSPRPFTIAYRKTVLLTVAQCRPPKHKQS
jgi:hypothetical protein